MGGEGGGGGDGVFGFGAGGLAGGEEAGGEGFAVLLAAAGLWGWGLRSRGRRGIVTGLVAGFCRGGRWLRCGRRACGRGGS